MGRIRERVAARRPDLARQAADAALWAVPTALLVAELSALDRTLWGLEAGVLGLAAAVAVGLSRRHPATAVAVVVAAALSHTLYSNLVLHGPWAAAVTLPVAVVAFLAGRRAARTAPIVAVVVASAAVLLAAQAVRWLPGADVQLVLTGVVDWAGSVLLLVLVLIAPWLAGRYWRRHTAVATTGWILAERMERRRDLEAERARLRERARIAADMHDSLGHHLTLIGVRAAALEMADTAETTPREAAAELRRACHEANLRLREIIGVLREESAGNGEAPHQGSTAQEGVGEVVARAEAAGPAVRLLREGPDPDPATEAGAAACRVVQEAVTNAVKHAPGARVTVHVAREAGATTVRVHNDGPRTETQPHGGGSGLAELRSRLAELGGDFAAGPDPDGAGFTVTARVEDDAGLREDATGDAASETARTRDEVAGQARRGLRAALVIPSALALAIVGLGFLVLTYVSVNRVLPAEDYEALRIGEDEQEVQQVLPRFEFNDPRVADAPPAPEGASCRYYIASREGGLPPVYRLCFDDGHLVAKHRLEQHQ